MAIIDDLLAEADLIGRQAWFVQNVEVSDRTDATITLRLVIDAHLFVQVFFSQRTGRHSLALIGPVGRLFGWDWEHGGWHLHPFGRSEQHEPMPTWVPERPLSQFMAEVEELVIVHGLL